MSSSDSPLRWILLQPRSKHPISHRGHHRYSSDPEEVRRHLRAGGNVGRPGDNHAILDWDDEVGRLALFQQLGELPLHVATGSGKHHTYVSPDPTLPPTIWYEGRAIGQVKRLPTEYVVSPPSIHPSGGRYLWLIPPPHELQPLPEIWRSYLESAERDANPSGQPGEEFVIPDSICAGARHRTFFRWARSWKARGFTLDQAIEIILLANSGFEKDGRRVGGITHPPLPEDELERFIERCWSQPDRKEFQR